MKISDEIYRKFIALLNKASLTDYALKRFLGILGRFKATGEISYRDKGSLRFLMQAYLPEDYGEMLGLR